MELLVETFDGVVRILHEDISTFKVVIRRVEITDNLQLKNLLGLSKLLTGLSEPFIGLLVGNILGYQNFRWGYLKFIKTEFADWSFLQSHSPHMLINLLIKNNLFSLHAKKYPKIISIRPIIKSLFSLFFVE